MLGCIILVGCSKPAFDYRSKYVGTYDVVSYNSNWVMGQVQQYDTVHYTLQVKRSKDVYYVDFITEYGESTYLLEKNGTLHYETHLMQREQNDNSINKQRKLRLRYGTGH